MRRYAIGLILLVIWLDAVAAPAVLPSFDTVKSDFRSSEAWLLDRHGEEMQNFRIDREVRRLSWVPLVDMSPALKEALVTAEDKRFFEHGGVDWRTIVGAAWDNLWRMSGGQRQRGASTLTMQLVGMLDPGMAPQAGGRSLRQKWDQIKAARQLEKHWSKEQILEAYLNLVHFRGELTGINAAAWGMFQKSPAGIDRPEAALLVALLRGPAASPNIVVKRACALLKEMARNADCQGKVEVIAQRSLRGPYDIDIGPDLAPHLRRLAGKPDSRTITTLDRSLQRLAIGALHQQLSELMGRHVEDGAVVVLDNASGDVLAYVGSSGDLSQSRLVDGVMAPRQAGSTLKPFLYGLAIEQRILTAASVLEDSSLALQTEAGLYIPQDYDKDFKGPVTVRTALASSLNVPAVRTLVLAGFEPFRSRLRSFGLETIDRPGDYYGYSLALGSAEVNLLQLTNAYRALANGGRWMPVRFLQTDPIIKSRRVMDKGASFIIADILSDREARAVTFGLENPLATRIWTAVKTGTSKDMRDNWCIGFSSRYTVGVWVGNASGEPMQNVSGVTGAAPIWREIIQLLHGNKPSERPSVPKEVERVATQWIEPMDEAARNEWFLRGTKGEFRFATVRPEDSLSVRIGYPSSGTIIALDPDIPADRQLVPFKLTKPALNVRWVLDGETVEERWHPKAGHHVLELRSSEDHQLDRVEFDVRGSFIQIN